MHKYLYMITSLHNTESKAHVVFAVGSSPRTLTRMQESERDFGDSVLAIQRFVADGSCRCENRAFRSGGLCFVLAEASLETQLRRRHRRGNRATPNRVQWRTQEGTVDSQPPELPLKQRGSLAHRQANRRSHQHRQQREGESQNFEAYLREALLENAGQHDRWLAEKLQPQTPLEYRSLFTVYFGRCENRESPHDGEDKA